MFSHSKVIGQPKQIGKKIWAKRELTLKTESKAQVRFIYFLFIASETVLSLLEIKQRRREEESLLYYTCPLTITFISLFELSSRI